MVLLCSLLNLNNCQKQRREVQGKDASGHFVKMRYLQKVKIVESIQKLAYIFTFYYYTYNITRLVFDVTLYLKNVFFYQFLKKNSMISLNPDN